MLNQLQELCSVVLQRCRQLLGAKRRRSISISEIHSADLRALAAIHQESFRDGWSDGALETMLANPHFSGLIARQIGGGELPPLGFVLARTVADEAEIITIATAGRQRRKGVALALMSELIRRFRSDSVSEVFLEVRADNLPAVRLYQELGFLQVADRVGYYRSAENQPDQRTNALVMKLELD